MRNNKRFKRLSTIFLFSVFSMMVWMWKAVAVTATEESEALENTIASNDSDSNLSDIMSEEEEVLAESSSISEGSGSSNSNEEESLSVDAVTTGFEETEPLALEYVGVSELEWFDFGTISFKVNDSIPGFYVIYLYKDGNIQTTYRWGDLSGKANSYVHIDVRPQLIDNGDYTFLVKISPDDNDDLNDFSTGCVSQVSPAYHYEKPTESVLTPTELEWDSQAKGLAKWNAVENADAYNVRLYKDGNIKFGIDTLQRTQYDFGSRMGEEGSYTFVVQAVASAPDQYANSEWSSHSAALVISSETDKTLEEIFQNDNAVEAVNDLKNGDKVNKSELKIAMQSEANVQSKMQQLENSYIEEQGITVASPTVEDVAIASEKISVLGAGMNADRGQEVILKISRPDAESPYNPDVYKNVVQFNMDLLIDGMAKKELDIPVTVTLPVPDGMNVDRLFILHYSSADGSYETILPRNNGNGTVSFTLTHFSTFAFAETQDESMVDTDDVNGDSDSITDSSDEEIEVYSVWQPVTPDEIKRYGCKGKEKIDYILAKENDYLIEIKNAMQGPMCFASFENVLSDYIIGRTYNIYPVNHLTYSMNKEVEITLKIPEAIYQPDRIYKMICVTKGGQPIIYDDLDKVPETITFKTNTFYAYALIYK